MLVLSFFTMVFVSVLWLVLAGFYLSFRFAGADFYTLGLSDVALCAILVFLPLLFLWVVWGHFCRLRHEASLQKQFLLLSSQIRQNQEYCDVIARLMIKKSRQQTHAFAMGKIDIYISEMNEILSDILRRYRFLNEEDIHEIWTTVRLGNRWGFAKAFVDLCNAENNFEDKLLAATRKQTLLESSLTEFCARYTRLLELLKEHDEENVLQEIIETGAFGRVFAMFAPIVRRLYEKKQESEENITPAVIADDIVIKDDERFFKDDDVGEYSDNEPGLFDDLEKEDYESKEYGNGDKAKPFAKSFWRRLLRLHDEEDDTPKHSDPDPLTIALERSFGISEKASELEAIFEIANTNPQQNEPVMSVDDEKKETIVNESIAVELEKRPMSKRFAFANTDKTIKSLQKEWEEMKRNDKAATNVQKNTE